MSMKKLVLSLAALAALNTVAFAIDWGYAPLENPPPPQAHHTNFYSEYFIGGSNVKIYNDTRPISITTEGIGVIQYSAGRDPIKSDKSELISLSQATTDKVALSKTISDLISKSKSKGVSNSEIITTMTQSGYNEADAQGLVKNVAKSKNANQDKTSREELLKSLSETVSQTVSSEKSSSLSVQSLAKVDNEFLKIINADARIKSPTLEMMENVKRIQKTQIDISQGIKTQDTELYLKIINDLGAKAIVR
jgi:hypothetical protein